jgi:hypothetical protein
VIGYVDPAANPVELDAYQCKHYDHALYPSDLWPELGKFCAMAFQDRIPIPRNYYIVVPQDTGPELTALLDDPAKLKAAFVTEWLDEGRRTRFSKESSEASRTSSKALWRCSSTSPTSSA